jgi:phosphohistidine phosphatase
MLATCGRPTAAPDHRIRGRPAATASGPRATIASVPGARQLYVLRHAKSSWSDPGLDDRERPLAPRGKQAVKLLAEHLRANVIRPQLVLVSPAKRTRETLEGIAPGGEVMVEPELYGATAASLVRRLRRVPEGIRSAMLIGHNPAMQALVLELADKGSSDPARLKSAAQKFPTGALATFELEAPWAELRPGAAVLRELVRPKDLRQH